VPHVTDPNEDRDGGRRRDLAVATAMTSAAMVAAMAIVAVSRVPIRPDDANDCACRDVGVEKDGCILYLYYSILW